MNASLAFIGSEPLIWQNSLHIKFQHRVAFLQQSQDSCVSTQTTAMLMSWNRKRESFLL